MVGRFMKRDEFRSGHKLPHIYDREKLKENAFMYHADLVSYKQN